MDYDDDDYDVYSFHTYKGFDLSDLTDREVFSIKDKIDIFYKDMTMIKEFCDKFLNTLKSSEFNFKQEIKLHPSLYNQMIEYSVRLYGKHKGTEIAYLILGHHEEFSKKMQMAKAKALILSYERHFEDDENIPVHPSDFEESDLFKTITKLSGGKNIFPDFGFS